MAAQIIDGTAIAKGIRQKLNAEIGEKQRTNPRYKPSLVIIQGGWDVRQADLPL
jgi:methylenetetrahydrofolate dehydrogenase (NADP+)/methenyltetrahydrofolate cyclohydrolase/formyltetrahydrofolate synthetase